MTQSVRSNPLMFSVSGGEGESKKGGREKKTKEKKE